MGDYCDYCYQQGRKLTAVTVRQIGRHGLTEDVARHVCQLCQKKYLPELPIDAAEIAAVTPRIVDPRKRRSRYQVGR